MKRYDNSIIVEYKNVDGGEIRVGSKSNLHVVIWDLKGVQQK